MPPVAPLPACTKILPSSCITMTSPGPVYWLARRSKRIAPYWPGPVTPLERIQIMRVPRLVLNSALAARVTWLPRIAANGMSPSRVTGVGDASVEEATQVAPALTPLRGVPEGFESTITLALGGASKLNRSVIASAPTSGVPPEKPTPAGPLRQASSAKGSLVSAPVQE